MTAHKLFISLQASPEFVFSKSAPTFSPADAKNKTYFPPQKALYSACAVLIVVGLRLNYKYL